MLRNKSGRFPAQSGIHESYFLAADFFQSFSNPKSLMILEFVRKHQPASSRHIAERLGLGIRVVLAELKAMQQEGILVSHEKTPDKFYLADPRMMRAFDRVLEFPMRKLKRTASTPSLKTDSAHTR